MSARGGAADRVRLVNRLKNTNPDMFRSMCMMHLSFLLDLPDNKLDELLNNNAADRCSKKLHNPFFSSAKKSKINRESCCESGIIGASLSLETIQHIDPLFDFLGRPENLQQEGLFRKSGQLQRQKLLREKLNNVEDIAAELETGAYSAHDVANLLKAFLGELPEPLLTDKHYPAYCQVPEMVQKGLKNYSDRARSLVVDSRTDMVQSDMESPLLQLRESRQLQTIQLLFQLLPRENLLLLESVLSLLHRVTCVEDNKMTANTLGMLFAPCILVPRKMSGSELQSITENIIRATSFMIEKAPELFTIPEPLVRDIANYWEEMEEATENRPGSASSNSSDEVDSCRHSRLRRRLDPSCDVVNTTVTFVDRAVAAQAAAKTDTDVALAQLYAHVSSMPESSKKRKLLKQFNKANGAGTPTNSTSKHKRTLSLGESLKKMVGRNHKRKGSGHAVQLHSVLSHSEHVPIVPLVSQHTPIIKRPQSSTCTSPAVSTPVMRLFRESNNNNTQQSLVSLPMKPRLLARLATPPCTQAPPWSSPWVSPPIVTSHSPALSNNCVKRTPSAPVTNPMSTPTHQAKLPAHRERSPIRNMRNAIIPELSSNAKLVLKSAHSNQGAQSPPGLDQLVVTSPEQASKVAASRRGDISRGNEENQEPLLQGHLLASPKLHSTNTMNLALYNTALLTPTPSDKRTLLGVRSSSV